MAERGEGIAGRRRHAALDLEQPGASGCGQKESGKERVARRGASMARCTGMPYAVTLRKTCSMACCCTSPPGVPNGMKSLPSLKAMAGAGVRRGRLPGATSLGWPGASQPCEPRGETTQPTPGTTGESTHGSLGVDEKPLPCSSTTHT